MSEEFAATLERHLLAIERRDLASFDATIHDDVNLVGTDGRVIEGRADAVEAHRRWFADPEWRLESQVIFRDTKDGVAWALVRVLYEAQSTTAFYLFLLFTLDATDGRWRLLYDQGTTVKQ